VLLKKIFVWRKKVYKKFSWKKKFIWIPLHEMGYLLWTKISPTKNQQQLPTKNLHIYQQISMFFDICDLTMRTESPILLLSPSTKFDVNLFDDIYYYYPSKNIHFPQNFWNLQEKKRKFNFRECFASFFCRKKRTKNFTVRLNELTGIF